MIWMMNAQWMRMNVLIMLTKSLPTSTGERAGTDHPGALIMILVKIYSQLRWTLV
jgi:hypothetical protein